MKRTFKKVLSTVVASLFVLQSASLATVSIGAAGTNEVLKSTPTLDGTKDEAYAASWGYTDTVSWGSVDFSFLYDDEYLYVYADIKNNARGAYDALDMALMITANPNNNWTDVHTATEVVSNPFWTDGTAMFCRHYTNIMDYVETGDNLGWQPGQAPKGATHQGETPATEYSLTATDTGAILEYRIKGAFVKDATVSFAATDGLNGWTALWNATDYTTFVLGGEYIPTHTHEWATEYTIDVEPTCSTAGSKSIHCLTCDAKNAETVTPIEALGHNFVDGVCDRCGVGGALKYTPELDGVIESAYKKSAKIELDTGKVYGIWGSDETAAYANEAQRVSGATAYFLWDDGNVYVAVDVKDPTGEKLASNWGPGENMQWSDSVTVSMFRNNNALGEAAGITANAYEPFAYRSGYNGGLGTGWSNYASHKDNSSKYAVSTYDGGYVVEFVLDGSNLSEGNVYNVDLGVWDVTDHTINPYGGVTTVYRLGHCFDGTQQYSIALSNDTYNHQHVWESDYTIDSEPTCTKMGVKSIHCVDFAECGGVTSRVEIPKLAHTAGELTTTEPTCVEDGKTTSVCAVCGNEFTVETTPALGHNVVNGKCERCGEYVNSPSNVPFATAVVDGTKDAAYDSGAKYYVNGATVYVVYDKDYFYAYVEADSAENIAYLTIGNPDTTGGTGGFWTNTASVKFDFTAKNLSVKAWEYSVYNQNGASTFADNISVDTGETCIAKAGTDYVYAGDANAVEIKIHIGEGYAPNNYAGRAFVGSTMYYLGLGTENAGVNLNNNGGSLNNAIVKLNGLVNLTLDKCLGGCVKTERVTTVEPTCTAVGTSVEKCTVCGAEVEGSAQDVAMLDHDYKRTVTVEATCEVAGTSAEKCTVCGAIKDGTAVEIPALGHDWEYTVDTAPTCTADGIAIARACKRTGCDVYEEGSFVLPALGHNYNELGICANCGDNKSLKVATYSVTLMDVLNINAKINKADVAAYDSFYVKFVEHYKDGSADNVKIVTEYSYESSRDRYVFAYGSTPQCAVDDVDVYVYGVKDGVTYESTAVYTANITSYLYTMLGRSTDTSLNRLMVHLLDYIAAAQQFAEYSTASLANANLTDAMKALRLPENTNYNNTFSETVNEGVSGATYLARSLYCDDSISFKYNFTFDASKYSIGDIKVVVKYKDDGDTMAEYTGDQIVYDTARSRYYVVVGLIAQNLSKDFEINVYTLDGTLISNKTLVNSIESMAAAYSAYPQYTDFLAAMMQYGRAAAAYANR